MVIILFYTIVLLFLFINKIISPGEFVIAAILNDILYNIKKVKE